MNPRLVFPDVPVKQQAVEEDTTTTMVTNF
jgi:hypothetical protein